MQNVLDTPKRELRQSERKPYSNTIDYSISILESKERRWLDLKGKAIDICDTGIGIETDYPLEPGHMMWFNGGMEDKAGFVRWCTKLDNAYRVGIKLDGKQIRHLDEATEVFNKQLEEIEKRCSDPEANPDEILKSITIAVNDIIYACENFEREVQDKDILRDARIRFREKTNPILFKSYFINRARTWPQGYQGDYKMLETIYRNTPLSEGIGYYLDLCSLNTPLAIAVRNRIKKLQDILRDELQKRQKPSVLNIACGSCREVFELAPEIEKSGAKFTCIDLDNNALSFAANRLSYTNISPLTSDQVNLRKYNALRMFDHEMNMSEFGKQDIIYSVGFFDYLASEFLSNLLGALYAMLKPGGKLIASFKDANRYRHQDYHWIGDWDGFLQRNEEDFRSIFFDAKIPENAITEMREDSGVIVFYTLCKHETAMPFGAKDAEIADTFYLR
jgi:extracellular factor (EF) 3-hydroxypalmitic acid methyl ester biosynthesis protein